MLDIKIEKELFEELNNKKSNNLIPSYLNIQKYFENKYGKNTLVMIEIGSFYEIYEVNTEDIEIGKAKEISELLNIQLTRKNKSINEISIKNPLMAGIPSVSLDKYLSRIIDENKWTIVLIVQDGEVPRNITRKIDKIISPGTNIEYLKTEENNFISSIFIEKNNKDIFIVGVSSIDLTTGISKTMECYGTLDDKENAIDELNEFLISQNSNEIIINKENISDNEIEEILQKINISNISYVIKDHNNKNENNKITYQNHLLKNTFNTNTFLSPIEELDLETKPFAILSLICLIEFIIEHDYKIIKNLEKPEITDSNKMLYIGNNALEQLNIISKGNISVLDIINIADTPMGRRLTRNRIKNPIIDKKEIKKRYLISELLIKENYSDFISNNLKNIFDIERLNRRINLEILHPYELIYFHTSLNEINKILSFFINKKEFKFIPSFDETFKTKIQDILNNINDNFDLNIMNKFNLLNISENFINIKKNEELSDLIEEYNKEYSLLEDISNYFSNLIQDKIKSKKENIHSKIIFNERDGYFIEISKNKFNTVVKPLIEDINNENKFTYISKFNFKVLTQTVKIDTPEFEKISNNIFLLKTKIINLNKKLYINFLKNFSKEYNLFIKELIYFVSEIDSLNINAKLYKKHNFNIPKIISTENNEMFIEAKALRHPIIEKIESNGIYIPNDVVIGNKKYAKNKDFITYNENDDIKGILLYGINSSGKSSYMKSIGISIILAQSGFFVPANEFRYTIFKKIFTRIYGEDNLHKGLSTFAVEMLELKNILKRSDKNSLILGDEISHGTETISGLSIVASAILNLSKRNNLFIFATHLHQLVKMDIIKKLKTLTHLHLSIHYDETSEKLIYDRKLKHGSGSSLYGLEFAKSLQMDNEFLLTANKIRKELTKEFDENELLIQKKKSKYNSNLYITKCVICGKNTENADDIHHIKEQQDFKDDERNNYLKNHKYNLLPLCKKHHKEIHNITLNHSELYGENGMKWISTSTGKKLWIHPKLKELLKIDLKNCDEIISF